MNDTEFSKELEGIRPQLYKVAINRYRSSLYGHVTIDDLVQDTIVKAWANRDKYKGLASLYTWCRVILHREFLDKYRTTLTVNRGDGRRRVLSSDDKEVREYIDTNRYVEDTLLTDLRNKQLVEEAVGVIEQCVGSDHILDVTLRGMPIKDAASKYGVNPNLVRVHIHRCRKKLDTLYNSW